jgi:multicomponent Na+:H+ antiporter subunit G
MWSEFLHYIAAAILLLGAFFSLIGAIGLLRLPDVYARSHAASKAGTVGSGLALIAIAIEVLEPFVATRAIAAVLFFVLTAPVSAHLLMRAAYLAGYPMWRGSVIDEMPKKTAM